jgi:hypothetical protein
MSNELEPWKKRMIKKGRILRHLLQSGPASIDSILVIAKIDNPNATRDEVENILSSAPHKFFKTEDGSWGAYEKEPVRIVYKPSYYASLISKRKASQSKTLEGAFWPTAPTGTRFNMGEDGIPSVIIMGDELMNHGTPRLLIEFKSIDLSFANILKKSFMQETPVRFFLNTELGSQFIGTRIILDFSTFKQNSLFMVASPSADDARRLIAPSKKQLLIMQDKTTLSQLPALKDITSIIPYTIIPSLPESKMKVFSIPCSEKNTDFTSIQKEYYVLRSKLIKDPNAWEDVKKFLEVKKPIVDNKTWERLLLMVPNTPNAKCIDLVDILYLHIFEEPSSSFAFEIIRLFSEISDPEGKISMLIADYADIAKKIEPQKCEDFLILAHSFRRNNRHDEAAMYYLAAIKKGLTLTVADACNAADSFQNAKTLSRKDGEDFLEIFKTMLFNDDGYFPNTLNEEFEMALYNFTELICKYKAGDFLDTVSSILWHLTDAQYDDMAKEYYLQYSNGIKKYADRLEFLSYFEKCESITTLEWLMHEICYEFERYESKLTSDNLLITFQQISYVEQLAGSEPQYPEEIKKRISKILDSREHKIDATRINVHSLQDLGENIIIAIIGGNNIYQKRMEIELLKLGASRIIKVEPSFDARIDQTTLKQKIRAADLILFVATYSKHDEYYMLQNLKNSHEIAGTILPVNGGPSRSLRDIKKYLKL